MLIRSAALSLAVALPVALAGPPSWALTPQDGATFPAPSCDPATLTTRIGSYGFDGDLDASFDDHPLWQDHPTEGVINDAVFYQRNGRLEFEVPSASQAASEAWRTWRTSPSSDKSWRIRADVTLPLTWNRGSDDEHQIGVGLWVGKPGGSTVYEIDFLAVAAGRRAILAQNIQDRHGGDPNYVPASISPSTASVRMEIMFCSEDRTLSIYYDGDNRVDTQPIDDAGLFSWNIGPVFEVGMIGFAEGPSATSDFPYLDNWEVLE